MAYVIHLLNCKKILCVNKALAYFYTKTLAYFMFPFYDFLHVSKIGHKKIRLSSVFDFNCRRIFGIRIYFCGNLVEIFVIEGEEKKSTLTNCCFTTISSQISAIYMNIFHKTEVQTVILRC